MSHPVVSVIIPSYNYGVFIAEAIESVSHQTYSSIECIVVDDGSTDDTQDIVNRYSWVRYIAQANGGVSKARNTGVKECSGEYVQFLDADDTLLPGKVESCVSYALMGDKVIPFSEMSDMFSRKRDSIVSSAYSKARRLLGEDSPRWEYERQLESLLRYEIGVMSALYPTHALREIGGFDHTLKNLEDIELNYRLALEGYEFVPTGGLGAYCRHHPSPSRGRKNPEKYRHEFKALKQMLERTQAREGLDTVDLRRTFAYRFARLASKDPELSSEAMSVAQQLDDDPSFSSVPILDTILKRKVTNI